ncbi:hypothetical protein ACE6H2_016867 [Prunus campanulata]
MNKLFFKTELVNIVGIMKIQKMQCSKTHSKIDPTLKRAAKPKKNKSNKKLKDINPCLASFWIQANGMPLGQMNAKNGTIIAKKIGRAISVENLNQIDMRGFLHMWVQLDTSLPLQRGFWLPSHKSALSWVKFRYEGLHRFCQRCDRLGHVDKNESMCNHPLCPVVENDGIEFGAWMGTDFVHGPTPLSFVHPAKLSRPVEPDTSQWDWRMDMMVIG